MENRIEFVSILISALGGIIMLYANVFADIHRSLALWINYIGACFILFGPFLYIQDCYWEQEAKAQGGENLLVPGDGEIPEFGISEPMSQEEIDRLHLDDLPEGIKRDLVNRKPPKEWAEKFKAVRESESFVLAFLGNSVIWTDTFPMKVLSQSDEDMVRIERDGLGISLTAKFFNQRGDFICHIVNNRFRLNSANYTMDDSTPHKLIVYDNAKEVLSVEYINPRAVRILGDFYLRNGAPIVICPNRQTFGNMTLSGSVVGNTAGGIVVQ